MRLIRNIKCLNDINSKTKTKFELDFLLCHVMSTCHFYDDILMHFYVVFTYNRQTEGYSGSDLTALARDAALGPIRGKF